MRVFTYFFFFNFNNILKSSGLILEPETNTMRGENGRKKFANILMLEESSLKNVLRTKYFYKKEIEGFDMTNLLENEEENIIMLNKIGVNLKKQKLLQQLESKSVSNLDKLKMIEENEELFSDKNKLTIDLSSGGLYNDFNFNFE
jgi:hypothetical protein